MLCLHAVTDEDGHPLENENENESGRRLCEYWGTILQACVEGERHHCLETIFSYVQRAPDSICREIDRNEFDERLAIKKESAPGPDGFHIASTDVREAWVLGFSTTPINMSLALSLRCLLKAELFSSPSPQMTTTIRIVRSPEALRRLTLCNCDCKILTTAICRGLH